MWRRESQDPATSLTLPVRSWMGTYAGTAILHDVECQRRAHGALWHAVVVSATSHTITLDEEGAAIVLANDEDGTTYRYRAAYGEMSEDLNGMVSLTLTYEDKEAGNRQSYRLNRCRRDVRRVMGWARRTFFCGALDGCVASRPTPLRMPCLRGCPWRRIEEGRSNVNVRETAPSGRIVRKVDGGLQFTINDEKAMSDPMHLLKEPMRLVAMDGSKSIAKAANAKLDVVGEAGNHWSLRCPTTRAARSKQRFPRAW